MKAQRGLTLIELLIAMTIFAVIAVMSYRSLSGLMQTRTQLQAETSRLRDVSLFLARVESDLDAVIDRAIRNVDDNIAAPLCVSAFAVSGNEATLAFTRGGFAETDGLGSAPQRIGYRLRDNVIEMLQWPALDAAPRSVPEVFPALGDIRALNLRTLDKGGVWRNEWPPAPATCVQRETVASTFPGAIELTLTLATGEVITRVFAIRDLGTGNEK